ncbi:MAG: aminoacyl-tRNA hydrolase [Armatimonadaceae bacterium]
MEENPSAEPVEKPKPQPTLKAIVGLGNPGPAYAGTRHNVGFDLIDLLAKAHQIPVERKEYRSLVGRGKIGAYPVLLVKPQTFMNSSGEAVGAVRRGESLTPTDFLILTDDIHLPVGRIRLRAQGSSGGQNGVKSIVAHLGTQEFHRLRIGVGEPPPGLQIDWVLGKFSRSDRTVVDETLIVAMGAVEVWLRDGIETAMNRFNNVVVDTKS